MNYLQIADALEKNTLVFRSLLESTSIEKYTWKPAPNKWSLLDIICHLVDEEILDFRARVEHVLFHAEEPMPSIDPEGWVQTHEYAKQDFEAKIKTFTEERTASVTWLRELENPKWKTTYKHADFGEVTAQLFLENWLAHDYMHLKQIIKQNYSYLVEVSKGNFRYAGGD